MQICLLLIIWVIQAQFIYINLLLASISGIILFWMWYTLLCGKLKSPPPKQTTELKPEQILLTIGELKNELQQIFDDYQQVREMYNRSFYRANNAQKIKSTNNKRPAKKAASPQVKEQVKVRAKKIEMSSAEINERLIKSCDLLDQRYQLLLKRLETAFPVYWNQQLKQIMTAPALVISNTDKPAARKESLDYYFVQIRDLIANHQSRDLNKTASRELEKKFRSALNELDKFEHHNRPDNISLNNTEQRTKKKSRLTS